MRLNRIILLCLMTLFSLKIHAFTLQTSRWNSNQVTLHVALNLNGGLVSSSGLSWDQGFQQAAQLWQGRTGFSLNLINQLSDPCAGVELPGQGIPIAEDGLRNGIGFNNTNCGNGYGSATLAVTSTYFTGSTTTESDISFNAAKNWDIYNGPWQGNKADFRRVAVHELGHLMGLGHEESNPSIMQSTLVFQNTIEAPTQDDINGINSQYDNKTLEPIVLKLEEPGNGEVKTGIANLRGWVVSLTAIDRLELFLDGQLLTTVPSGAVRDDVAGRFPDYPTSRNSGFSMAINYSNLSAGSHTALIRAVDKQGRSKQASSQFTVVRFDTPFISNASKLNLDAANVSFSSDTISIDRLQADGKFYKLVLQWQVATQSYEVVQIKLVSP